MPDRTPVAQERQLVTEPIQGEGGFIEPAPGFLPALAEWCRANDVVFVADEVQTGSHRERHRVRRRVAEAHRQRGLYP